MSLYNIVPYVSTTFSQNYLKLFDFFLTSCHFMPLPFLKFLPTFSLAIASRESVIASDIASVIAPNFGINLDSALKKIQRFLSNQNYDFSFFYHKFISNVISTYKIKHPDKRVHIVFDHMHAEEKFTVLMFSLKVGKQSIPLWFRCFDYGDKDAFKFELFKEGIVYCHDLIKSVELNSKISYLADRFWGNHFKLMGFIESLDDTYNIRTKGNVVAFVYDEHEGYDIKKKLEDIVPYVFKSKVIEDIELSFEHFKTNLVISKSTNHVEPFYILTNGDYKRAIKDYSYRFAAIEFLFKGQKSAGFFLEENQIKNLYTFNSLYTCICITQTLLTMLGIDYAKNAKCYKELKIRNARIVNGKRRKDYSFFHIGLILITASLISNCGIKLFNRLILYDV